MIKRGLLVFAVFVFTLAVVSATSVSVNSVNTTLERATVSSASNLYAYEINFSIDSGSVGSVVSSNFLGSASEATYGSNEKGGYLYVYGSRLDNAKAGKSGDGEFFNISYSGGLTLRGQLLVDTGGSVSYAEYNAPAVSSSSVAASTSGGATTTTDSEDVATTEDARESIVVIPPDLSVNVVLGVESEREATILNNGDLDVFLSFVTENLDNAVTFDKSSFKLTSGEKGVLKIKFLVNENKLIAGKILIRSRGGVAKELPVVVNVRSEDFLFDSKISISQDNKLLEVGENLVAQVDLQQVGPKEKVDVTASYVIKDFKGNVFLEESETFFVLDDKNFLKEIHTANLPPGKYVLGLEIVYPGAFAVSSTQFEVLEEKPLFSPGKDVIIILGAGVLILIAIILIVWFFVRRKKIFRRKRKSR